MFVSTFKPEITEQYVPVVLFILLYKVIQTFESVDKVLKCDHSNESYRAINRPVCLFVNGPFFNNIRPKHWNSSERKLVSNALLFFPPKSLSLKFSSKVY